MHSVTAEVDLRVLCNAVKVVGLEQDVAKGGGGEISVANHEHFWAFGSHCL